MRIRQGQLNDEELLEAIREMDADLGNIEAECEGGWLPKWFGEAAMDYGRLTDEADKRKLNWKDNLINYCDYVEEESEANYDY